MLWSEIYQPLLFSNRMIWEQKSLLLLAKSLRRASKISVLFIVMSCYHEDVPFESKCARSNIGVPEFNFVVSYVIGAGVQGHKRGVLNGGSQEVFSYRLLSGPNRSFIETHYKISTWEPLTEKNPYHAVRSELREERWSEKERCSYYKVVIEQVRSGQTGKHLARG